MFCGGFGRCHRRYEMALHCIAVLQNTAVQLFKLLTAGRRNLISCRRSTIESWPAVTVARIKGIKHFPGVVAEAKLVEVFCVVLTDGNVIVQLLFLHMRVDRLRSRHKEVARVAAHFMQVDDHSGFVFVNYTNARFGFRLGDSQPVTVHIE